MGLNKAKCDRIINMTQNIADRISDYLHKVGVCDKTISMLETVIKNSHI